MNKAHSSPLSLLLRIELSLLAILFAASGTAYCDKPAKKVYSGLGCSISIDDSWVVSNSNENAQFLKQAEQLVATNDPQVQKTVDEATVLFSAIKEKKHLRTISLLAMPSEASQKEMAGWDAEFCKALQSALQQAIQPAQRKLGYQSVVYAEPRLEIINGVRCFVLKYEYVDSHGVPSITEKRYFYLTRGTFVLTLSYDKILAEERRTGLDKVIASFAIAS